MNKESFLKTEFGSGLKECIVAWDHWITERSKFNSCDISEEYQRVRASANWCQAQWEVYQLALRQFCKKDYHFTRTDEYFGVCTEDEADWLFKVYR